MHCLIKIYFDLMPDIKYVIIFLGQHGRECLKTMFFTTGKPPDNLIEQLLCNLMLTCYFLLKSYAIL